MAQLNTQPSEHCYGALGMHGPVTVCQVFLPLLVLRAHTNRKATMAVQRAVRGAGGGKGRPCTGSLMSGYSAFGVVALGGVAGAREKRGPMRHRVSNVRNHVSAGLSAPPPPEAGSDDSGDERGRRCTNWLDALWPEGTRGWNKHHCRESSICKSWEAFEGATWLGHRFSRRSMPSLLPLVVFTIWVIVNAILLWILEVLMAQMAFANTPSGEKYHGAWFKRLFPACHLRCTKR